MTGFRGRARAFSRHAKLTHVARLEAYRDRDTTRAITDAITAAAGTVGWHCDTYACGDYGCGYYRGLTEAAEIAGHAGSNRVSGRKDSR